MTNKFLTIQCMVLPHFVKYFVVDYRSHPNIPLELPTQTGLEGPKRRSKRGAPRPKNAAESSWRLAAVSRRVASHRRVEPARIQGRGRGANQSATPHRIVSRSRRVAPRGSRSGAVRITPPHQSAHSQHEHTLSSSPLFRHKTPERRRRRHQLTG